MKLIFTNKETDTTVGKLFLHKSTGTEHYGRITRTAAIEIANKTKGLICAKWNGERLPVCQTVH